MVGLLACSSVLTLVLTSYPELLALMVFPPTEIELLDGLPLQGWHLAAFFGLPLLLTLVVLVMSKRHFGPQRPALL